MHGNKKATTGTSRLTTFKHPTPSAAMSMAITPVVRWLFLGGIPGLRSVPLIGAIPGIRGISNITKIEFPVDDKERLNDALAKENAAFVTPNHPEFFTDWMLDKTIVGGISPRAAYWATHAVVNGMGPTAQKFWLANNLIAQIPGGAGKAGKEYSIEYALKGNPVLLHPEGKVGWHGDLIGPLFSGAVDMALEAARRTSDGRKVLVAPIVWKLMFNHDVTPALHRELDRVEYDLKLPSSRHESTLARRLYVAYDALLARDEKKYDIANTQAPYFIRHEALVTHLLSKLHDKLDQLKAPGTSNPADDSIESRDISIRRGERWLRNTDRKSTQAKSIRALTGDLRRLLRFHPQIYPGKQLTREHIAESIKRIRNDYCTKTKRDMINKYIPQPVGPRTAIIRVPEPLDISAALETSTSPEKLVEELHNRMQGDLDAINRDLADRGQFILEPNPFAI